MVFSRGFVYRWGRRVKDFGERLGRARLFGIRIFGRACVPVIGLGNRIMDSVLGCPAEGR